MESTTEYKGPVYAPQKPLGNAEMQGLGIGALQIQGQVYIFACFHFTLLVAIN